MKPRKVWSILLTLCLIVSLLPAAVIPAAADGDTLCRVRLSYSNRHFYANLHQTYSILEIAHSLGLGDEYTKAEGMGPSREMSTTDNLDNTSYAVYWVGDNNWDDVDDSVIRFNRLCFGGTITIIGWKKTGENQFESSDDMVVSVSADIPFPGQGTEQYPYQINSKAAFLALSDYIIGDEEWRDLYPSGGGAGKYFVLTTDLDFSNDTFYPVGWDVQNGNTRANFGGTFDGGGYTIKGASFLAPDSSQIGVFGCLVTGAEIKNLRVANAQFSGNSYVGGIAGSAEGTYDQGAYCAASIHDCWVLDSSITCRQSNVPSGVIAGSCCGSGYNTDFSGNYYSGCTLTVGSTTYGADQKGLAYGEYTYINGNRQASEGRGDHARAQWATAGDPTQAQRDAGLYSLKANLNGKRRYIPLTAAFSPGGQEAYGDSLTYKYMNGSAIPITATLKGRDDFGNYVLSVSNENITFHIKDSANQDVAELTEPGSYTLTAVTNNGTASCPLTVAVDSGYAASFYAVTWKDYDGSTLRTDHTVEEGTTPSYGEAPTRADANGYSYTFAGWTPELAAATGDATYTATYTSAPIEYAIHYELGEGAVDPGNPASYTVESEPITLSKPTRAGWGFAGWTGTGLDSVTKTVTIPTGSTGERTYTANWAELYDLSLPAAAEGRSVWAEVDGETVTQAVAGDAVEVHITWSGGYSCTPTVTGAEYSTAAPTGRHIVLSFTMPANPVSVTADFTAVQYTITWVDGDGVTLKTDTLDYGDTPAYSGETPTKTPTVQLAFTFNDTWAPEITTVTGDQTYTAQFDQTTRTYTVTFRNWNNEVLQTGPVAYGSTPQYDGSVPQKDDGEYAWLFTGWSPALTAVTGEATYTAQFTQTDKKSLATCTATVPNPMYNDGYYIGYIFERDDHGGIEVRDPDGKTLTINHYDSELGDNVGDYFYSNVQTREPEAYEAGGKWYNDTQCTHVGEKCRLILEGCGDWAGILTVDFEILPLTGSGDWGDNLSWTFAENNATHKKELTITKKEGAASGAMDAADHNYEYPWYRFCGQTEAIVIGEGVTSVADNAFAGKADYQPYANVTAVTLPSTLTAIGDRAFPYMLGLTDIDLSHVETIGEMAFYYCSGLSVSVPATVRSIGESAFGGCCSADFILSFNGSGNGSLSVSVDGTPVATGSRVQLGSTVTVSAVPNEGYAVSLTVKDADGRAVNVTNNAFIMPSSHVTVSAVFGHAVTVSDGIANGTVAADKATAAENETVTLTVTPNVCYAIGTVSYNDGSEHIITPTAGVYSFTMPNADVTVSATFTELPAPVFSGKMLLLSGQIGMYFYLAIPDRFVSGSSMAFDVGGEQSTVETTAALKQDDGRYRFLCYINAVQMADTITATLHYTDGETEKTVEYSTTVQDYLDVLIENKENRTDYAAAAESAKALNDYGYYSQLALDPKAKHVRMAKAYQSESDLIATLSGYGITATLGTGVTSASYSLSLTSETKINLFFVTDGLALTKDNTSVSVNDKTTFDWTVEQVGERYCVQITGVNAVELGSVFTVTISGGTTVTASALSYVQQVLTTSQTATDAVKRSAAALYSFFVETRKYVSPN